MRNDSPGRIESGSNQAHSRGRLIFALLFLLALGLSAFGLRVVAPAGNLATGGSWESQVIYMIMTDRFNNGDKSNDYGANPADPSDFHGGDFQGIIDRLDYIKDLGVGAIWITPVYANPDRGYHGYWAEDFYKVDRHLGDLAKLKELVEKARRKGIKVLLDTVVNHTAKTNPRVTDPKYEPWFHRRGDIVDYNSPEEVENGDLAGLSDLAQENPEVSRYLIDMAEWWIEQTGVDGFRLDTVRHVPKWFWKDFAREIKGGRPDFFMIGEVWWESPYEISPYQDLGIDGLVDFPMYYAITDAFARGKGISYLSWALATRDAYSDPDLMGVFIDNHDVPRFLHQAEAAGASEPGQRLRAALGFMMSIPGIPIIYYGTESGMTGGADPDNRRDMEFGKDPALTEYVKKLAGLRRSHPALYGPNLTVVSDADPVLTIYREQGDDRMLAVFNVGDTEAQASIQLKGALQSGTGKFKDLLSGATDNAVNGKLDLRLKPWETRMYQALNR